MTHSPCSVYSPLQTNILRKGPSPEISTYTSHGKKEVLGRRLLVWLPSLALPRFTGPLKPLTCPERSYDNYKKSLRHENCRCMLVCRLSSASSGGFCRTQLDPEFLVTPIGPGFLLAKPTDWSTTTSNRR